MCRSQGRGGTHRSGSSSSAAACAWHCRCRSFARLEQPGHRLAPVVEHPAQWHHHGIGVPATQHTGAIGDGTFERLDPHDQMLGIDAVHHLGCLRTAGSFAQSRHAAVRRLADGHHPVRRIGGEVGSRSTCHQSLTHRAQADAERCAGGRRRVLSGRMWRCWASLVSEGETNCARKVPSGRGRSIAAGVGCWSTPLSSVPPERQRPRRSGASHPANRGLLVGDAGLEPTTSTV